MLFGVLWLTELLNRPPAVARSPGPHIVGGHWVHGYWRRSWLDVCLFKPASGLSGMICMQSESAIPQVTGHIFWFWGWMVSPRRNANLWRLQWFKMLCLLGDSLYARHSHRESRACT